MADNTRSPRHPVLRYAVIWWNLFRYSLAREMEFKTNFIGRGIIEVIWIFTQILFFSTMLKYMTNFGNLAGNEVWFFVGTMFFVDGLFMLFLHDNQKNFGQMIRGGLLDFHLLRPISPLFLANFKNVNAVSVLNLSIAAGVVIWSAIQLHLAAWQILLWSAYVVVGFVLICCLGVLTCSIAFWTTQTSNLLWFFFELYRLSFRPETIYGPWLRRVLLTVFPAALFMSLPVQLALGKRDGWIWYAYPFGIAAVAVLLTHWVWKRGIRNYEGAMS